MRDLVGTTPSRTCRLTRCPSSVLGVVLLLLIFFHITSCDSNGKKQKTFQITPRIVGESKIANIEMFEVSLFNQKHPHFCGGAIIAPNWVLTSAHCKGVCENNNLCAVRYATLELRKGFIAPIRLFISHEDFSKEPYLKNDIALVETPLEINTPYSIIPIHPLEVPYDSPLTLIGWGWTQMKAGTCSKHLRYSEIQRVPCPSGLSQSFFCAFAKDSNPCHGDSGGSLIYRGQLIGLVGFSLTDSGEQQRLQPSLRKKKKDKQLVFKSRCTVGETVAFTYVVKFVHWMRETMRNASIEYASIIEEPFKGWSMRDINLLEGLQMKKEEC